MPCPRFIAEILADALAPALARWSSRRETEILRHGVPLTAALEQWSEQLGIVDAGRVRVHIQLEIPLPLSARVVTLAARFGLPLFRPAGMALGRGIAAISMEPRLLKHELVHVRQYQTLGGHLPFMRAYIIQCLVHGYHHAPLEIEARQLAK